MNPLEEYRPYSILFLIQVTVIITGWIATAAHLKFMGYSDSMPPAFPFVWNPCSVFIRNWGFLLVFFPVAWVIASLILKTHPSFKISRDVQLLAGWILLVVLMLFLAINGFDVGHRPLMLHRPG